MIDSNFYNPCRLIFGRSSLEQLGQQIKQCGGTKVLLLYGGGSIFQNGVYDKVCEALKKDALFYTELGGVHANPLLSKVYEGIELCRQQEIDFLLAVGGGSVIDTAKAIGIGLSNPGDVWDYFVSAAPVAANVPVGSVLTIPAAGSESSVGTVIMNDKTQMKRAINSETLIPRFAVLNPEFTTSLPAWQTASGAADILAHLMERYFTCVEKVDYTDALLEASMRSVMSVAGRVLQNPKDYDLRAEMMLMGTFAHNNMLQIGRMGDWASHDIQHGQSALHDTTHGAGLAVIFPAWMKYVYREGLDRFAQFAVRVMGVNIGFCDREALVLEGIGRLENFYLSIGLPVRLSGLGIFEKDISGLVEITFADRDFIGNFKRLGADDVRSIYELAL